MKLSPILLCVFGLDFIHHAMQISFPRFSYSCNVNDPKRSTCYTKALDDIRPHLINGIKDFNIPPIDPIVIPKLSIKRTYSNLTQYMVNLNDIIITGTKDYKLLNIEVDVNRTVLKTKIGFKMLIWKCSTIAEGNIMGIHFNNSFNVRAAVNDASLDFVLDGKKFEKDGDTYAIWKEGSIEVTYSSFTFYIDTHGHQEGTTQPGNDLAKNNPDMLSDTVKKIISKAVGGYIIELFNIFHKHFPLLVLYGDV